MARYARGQHTGRVLLKKPRLESCCNDALWSVPACISKLLAGMNNQRKEGFQPAFLHAVNICR